MFLAQREASKATGIPATDYLTAKDDLELNLIQLLKDRSGIAPPAAEDYAGGDVKEADPADDDDDDDIAAADADESRLAEEALVAEEALLATDAAAEAEAELLVEEMAKMKVAEEAVALEAAKDDMDDFGDDW
jgi:coatomer subunit beta'